ncbi:hypothetical protein [Methylorubrum extorquens]|uniref:hypothetical protein n=1 Tax=Methylorubrum extorquens TaxID=408 RepID=UPI00209ECF99|nr:hypothetical protein [Methylorubrum extorquens]MCP1540093.1 hypothetical protein [Methylorubrum extorquens]
MTITKNTTITNAETFTYLDISVTLTERENACPSVTCNTSPHEDLSDDECIYETNERTHALIAASASKTLFAYLDCGPDNTTILAFETVEEAVAQLRESMTIVFDCEEKMHAESDPIYKNDPQYAPSLRAQLSGEVDRIANAFLADPTTAVRVNSDFDPAVNEPVTYISLESTTWGLSQILVTESDANALVVHETIPQDYRTAAA